jgi:hypothetical protein
MQDDSLNSRHPANRARTIRFAGWWDEERSPENCCVAPVFRFLFSSLL